MQAVSTPVPGAPTPEITDTPAPLPACTGTEPLPSAAHTVQANLAYRQQMVTVQQQIRYVNRTGAVLSKLVLDVEPNRWPAAFKLDSLTLDGDRPPQNYELTGRRLTVDLPQQLAIACPVTLNLAFTLRIPQIGAGLDGFHGYFGFGSRQINLSDALPMMATYDRNGWLLHDAPAVGEQVVVDPADWDVTLHVDGARDTLIVAGPGAVTQPDPKTWHFVQTGARDFSLSLSEQFHLLKQMSPNGVGVELYYFDESEDSLTRATYALDMATKAIAYYSVLFGQFPHQRYVVVQGDFPDGMEFTDLVFVSGDWFHTYSGSPASYLTLITVHETAHQWWYARVGSDQAVHPWLDEALATYSEYIFIEQHFPELRSWWWQFRVDHYIPPDFNDRTVNKSVYDFTEVRPYINAVYLHGARMLDAFRSKLGTAAFLDWLHAYADAGSGKIATPDLFWSVLTPAQMDQIVPIRDKYMG